MTHDFYTCSEVEEPTVGGNYTRAAILDSPPSWPIKSKKIPGVWEESDLGLILDNVRLPCIGASCRVLIIEKEGGGR